jgi:3-hydroxyacyl-CoA dehydrogenase/enoyl-CoA hydratase/3-hydroxybutyryl-CoA epimerase
MESLYKGKAFRLEQEGPVGILTFDLEGERVNKITVAAAEDLEQALNELKRRQQGGNAPRALLVRSGKKKSFIVGADINLIRSLPDAAAAERASAQGQAIFSKLEDLGIPTLAAIEGPCMGGGTELSLSCRHRIASDDAKTSIGLPEVKLGILPGWGGTWRLPKLVGLPAALDMILTGKGIRADRALRMGLVDALVPATQFEEKSLEIARGLAEGRGIPGAKPRAVSFQEKILTSNPLGLRVVFSQARKGVMAQTRGHYPAPLRILETLEKAPGRSREWYLGVEAKAFGELWATPESRNLVNLFFLSEDAKRNTGVESLTPADVAKLPGLRTVGVLGAGVMGGGIASQTAAAGLWTFVKDIQFDAVGKALAHARSLYDNDVRKKRLKPHERDKRMGLIRGQLDYQGFHGTDLVIEAVVENLDIKRKVFAELEGAVRPDTIIATNTSSLRLADMVAAFKHPGRFLGLHFFNPVHKMPLVEVVTLPGTSPEVTARAVAFVKSINKTPIVCKDGPGFIVNRLLMPWLNEAAYCLWEGYELTAIDQALKGFGMPMGPFELMDEIGIDVAAKVAKILHESLGARAEPSPLLEKISASKRLGRKSGLGFYFWDKPGGKRLEPDVGGIHELLFKDRAKGKPEFTPEAVVRRTLFPMVNEAAVILEEKLVTGPDQVDLGVIFGLGFPPFRGGLLRWADSIGLAKIEAELGRLAQVHGNRFQPTEALRRFAKEQGAFYK